MTGRRWIAGKTGIPTGDGETFMCESYTCPRCGGAYPPENVVEQGGRCTTPGCGFEDTATVISVPTFRSDGDDGVERIDRMELLLKNEKKRQVSERLARKKRRAAR